MDFTPELSAFQGAIISADNVHSFSNLTSKGDNENEMQYVIKSMLTFLKNGNYIDGNGVAHGKECVMRKFALFIVLNADLPVLKEMIDMEGLNMAIWAVPTISKYLLSEMLWKLYMDEFIYEIIAFSSPQLALELMKSLIENIKYLSPKASLAKLNVLSTACYRLITRLQLYNIENRVLKNILNAACTSFHECLNYYTTPPNVGHLSRLDTDSQYKYKGHCLYSILNVLSDCIDRYKESLQFESPDFHELYALTFTVDELDINKCYNGNRLKDTSESKDKFHILLLDTVETLLMDISVDIYCAWSEFESDGKNMQKIIGEFCYNLRKKLSSIVNIAEHPLLNMIQHIECKPVTVLDVINFVDADTIINNIGNNMDRDVWIHALLHRKNLCTNVTLIEKVTSNLDVFSNEEFLDIYNLCDEYLNEHTDNITEVATLLLKAFQQCDSNTKIAILDARFSNHCFYDMSELLETEFDNIAPEIFNKLISSPEQHISDVLNVFILSPQRLYVTLFVMAAQNHQQTKIVTMVMEFLERFSNHYYMQDTVPCLIRVIKHIIESFLDQDNKRYNFVHFICDLKDISVISGNQLLLLIITPSFLTALQRNDINAFFVQCLILSKAYSGNELEEYRVPLLSVLGKVMKAARWNVKSYVPEAPSTLDLVLQLQHRLFNSIILSEHETNWLREKLQFMKMINWYYYRNLWNAPNRNFIEIVCGVIVHRGMDLEAFGMKMTMIITSCVKEEWFCIWDNLQIFGPDVTLQLLCTVLAACFQMYAENSNENTWACLIYSYSNLVYTIKCKYLKEPLTANQVLTVVDAVAIIANLTKDKYIDYVVTLLMPLFAYIKERCEDYELDVVDSVTFKHVKLLDMVGIVYRLES